MHLKLFYIKMANWQIESTSKKRFQIFFKVKIQSVAGTTMQLRGNEKKKHADSDNKFTLDNRDTTQDIVKSVSVDLINLTVLF